MAANLVGFAVGLDGLQAMLTTLFKPAGMFFVVAAFLYFFSLVMIMFEVRKNEARTRLRDTN